MVGSPRCLPLPTVVASYLPLNFPVHCGRARGIAPSRRQQASAISVVRMHKAMPGRLREACLKRHKNNRFDDHWQALRILFKGLAEGETYVWRASLGGLV